MFRVKSILKYDPFDPRAARKGRESWWMMAEAPSSIGVYYAHWIRKILNRHPNSPLWGPHVSVCRGEAPKNVTLWKKYEGQTVELFYSHEMEYTDMYAWLPVQSPDLEDIRSELGLPPRPRCPFHLTCSNFKNTTPPVKKKLPFVSFPWEKHNFLDSEPNEYTIKE